MACLSVSLPCPGPIPCLFEAFDGAALIFRVWGWSWAPRVCIIWQHVGGKHKVQLLFWAVHSAS